MNIEINALYKAAEEFCRPLLNADEEYTEAFEANEVAWGVFCERCPEALCHSALHIISEYQHLDYLREKYFLIVGLQMGLELGAVSAFLEE